MSDPRAMDVPDDGNVIDPAGIDAIPSDWASIQYTIVIAPHPDNPSLPILKFIQATAAIDASPIYVDDGSGGFEPIYDNDGVPIYASD